jgi:hypothetical protein
MTLSTSVLSEPGASPIMCRVRFFRNATFSFDGVFSPCGRSQGLRGLKQISSLSLNLLEEKKKR